MKINIELTDSELREVRYAIDKQLDEVEYEIDEIEDTPVLQTKKRLLEKVLSKLNLSSDYEKRIRNQSKNKDLQLLVDKCDFTGEKILSYIHCSPTTETPRAVVGENRDNYTVIYEDDIWSIDV